MACTLVSSNCECKESVKLCIAALLPLYPGTFAPGTIDSSEVTGMTKLWRPAALKDRWINSLDQGQKRLAYTELQEVRKQKDRQSHE